MHLFHLSWDSYRKYSRSACDSWKIIHMFQKLSHLVLCGLEGCFRIKNGPRKQFGQHLLFAWSYYWTPNKTSTCAALAALGTIKNSISTLWSTVITELMRKRQRPKMAERLIQAAHQQTFKWTVSSVPQYQHKAEASRNNNNRSTSPGSSISTGPLLEEQPWKTHLQGIGRNAKIWHKHMLPLLGDWYKAII